MNTSLRKMWLSYLVATSVVAMVSAANEYLPPSKGYNYPQPNVPFPTDNAGIKQPAPTYRPPPTPTRPPPSYIPPPSGPSGPAQPDRPYNPPSTGPAYNPPGPTYNPPSAGPAYYPPPPAYKPPTTGSAYSPSHDQHDDHHHEPGMPFDFSYAVNEDGNDYSHNAISDGDVTRGEYRVALPDGRTQIVKYTADWKNGFNAEVTYEGEAKYPDQPAGGYGSGPASRPSGPGQQYVPPSQGGGYQY